MVVELDDRQARDAALDTARSFIVQAPAGSGKTELLIRRYLSLLATVQEPEQVVAITFTRKAAAEMRRRVLDALVRAAGDAPIADGHQAVTRRLAATVVRRDSELDWSLQAMPQRLRIETLDAFNVGLARQLPLLADGVAAAEISDDATLEYREAARRTVREVGVGDALGAALRALLRSRDNDFNELEALLAQLLPKREQWLGHLVHGDPRELRADLERALEELVCDELDALVEKWPADLLVELESLLRHATEFAADEGTRATLSAWLHESIPGRTRVRLAGWQAIAAMLLTQRGEWRRGVPNQHGFGPEHPEKRARWLALLGGVSTNDALAEALAVVANLPTPHYTEPQWETLAALRVVLLRLAAELKVVFAERRRVDFVELGLAARRALGRSDEPSELLLALDRRIQHVLVDEFQDTSQAQLRLLEQLTAGWQPDDGRTLFLVGDPMQSIYRFRDADVALFLKVKRDGVGAVSLTSVNLERNFRSSPQIVAWVNRVFRSVLPAQDEIATGTAGFRTCVATRMPAGEQFVRVHASVGSDPAAEVERAIEILAEERARNAEQSVAVLVQSRTHLAGLHERLRGTGWPVHAVEIDALAERQLGQDLLGLTRALTHFGDRIAWLAVLRAPWCGLQWRDLHALCHDEPARTIWELVHDVGRVERLRPDGRRRLARTIARLAAAFAARAARPLADWIEDAWLRLDGPACLDTPDEIRSAEQFFTVLDRHDQHGDVVDWPAFEEALARADSVGDAPREAGIEIMTMHRAKGLEFDTVVLLGLGREPRRDDPKALYWMQRVARGGRDDLIVAPLARGDGDRLTKFVKRAERRRDLAERARLLYVASTRARERLHLIGQVARARPKPAPHTLLSQLWPDVEREFAQARESAVTVSRAPSITPVLRRLCGDDESLPEPPPGDAAPAALGTVRVAARPEFVWSGQAAQHVGTVVHRYLQRFAEDGVDSWTTAGVEARAPRFRRELALLGVDQEDLARATARVVAALISVLDDAQGRWLLARHRDASSELRVTVRTPTGLEHIRLDRTFVDGDVRWIVDFKTGEHEGGDVEAFLDSEVERYRPQLERYAAALRAIDARAARVALYFPLLKALRSWSVTRSP